MLGGWTRVLALVLIVAGAAEAALPTNRMALFERLEGKAPSLLRLYFIPTAPFKLDWDTPRQLLLSVVKTTTLNSTHPIGHVAVEVQYQGLDDAEHHAFTGATDRDRGVGKHLLLKDEIGFGILERAWPGVLENEASLQRSVTARVQKADRLSVATFLINDAAALRLLDYVKTLRADTNPRYYGFAARPMRSEGSGCSAFGASFVDQIGALTPALKAAWSQSVRVPLALIGGRGVDKISVARVLVSGKASRWARPEEPHMFLEFFDPDLMHAWVNKVVATGDAQGLTAQVDPELPKLLDQRYHLGGLAQKNVKAILVDLRDVQAPEGPVLQGAPALKKMSDTTIETVTRTDAPVAPNGSFEIRP